MTMSPRMNVKQGASNRPVATKAAPRKPEVGPGAAVNQNTPGLSLSDLKPAPYNPRTLDAQAARGLRRSLAEFGDVSGVVWNKRSGHLVAGHQRLDALRKEHGDALRMENGAVVTPAGERFPVRIVDWPEDREKAANLAANSPLLAGSFVPGALEDLLVDLKAADGVAGLFTDLRLGELLPAAADLLAVPGPGVGPVVADGEDGAAGTHGEHVTFSVPLTPDQHACVMNAVRKAKAGGAEKLPDCITTIARSYLESTDE